MAEVSYDVPTNLPDAALLLSAAQSVAAIPGAKSRQDAVQTLFKLIDAVLASPEDAKRRRVRKANEAFHKKVGCHLSALDFLHIAGFHEADDPETPGQAGKGALLLMPVAYISRLTDAHHALASIARDVGLTTPPIPEGSFNPYQANHQQMAQVPPATNEWKGEAECLRDKVKRHEREMQERLESAPPVDLSPTVFWLSAGRRLEAVITEISALPEEDTTTDSALLQSTFASAKSTILIGGQNFQSADKGRLVELSRSRVHERCVLRVICPDKSVLQVHFLATGRGEHVMAQLAPLLAPHVREANWYLYQSPPHRRLGLKETLIEAGLTPGANLYLGFSGDRPGAPFL